MYNFIVQIIKNEIRPKKQKSKVYIYYPKG